MRPSRTQRSSSTPLCSTSAWLGALVAHPHKYVSANSRHPINLAVQGHGKWNATRCNGPCADSNTNQLNTINFQSSWLILHAPIQHIRACVTGARSQIEIGRGASGGVCSSGQLQGTSLLSHLPDAHATGIKAKPTSTNDFSSSVNGTIRQTRALTTVALGTGLHAGVRKALVLGGADGQITRVGRAISPTAAARDHKQRSHHGTSKLHKTQ